MGIRWAIASAALAATLSACASAQLQSDPGRDAARGDEHALTDALTIWSGFPVDSRLRPLVLTGPAVNDPASGFRTGEDKVAYVSGSFDLAATLPTGPSQASGQAIITAAQALTDLRAQGDGSVVTPSLKVTDVSLGTARFATDRGAQRLPAWIFTLDGVADPASVLAVPPANRWPKSQPPHGVARLDGFTVGPDGRRVSITFVGAGPGNGPCSAEYTADVAESRSAVAVSIRQLPKSQPSQPVACDGAGHSRTVTVDLSAELGDRVLVDADAVPVPQR